MNVDLEAASQDIVLFLDDDIVPSEALASKHFANYADKDVVAFLFLMVVAGNETTTLLIGNLLDALVGRRHFGAGSEGVLEHEGAAAVRR